MQEIDMKKLDLAIEYMKRMAEGNNPVTNQPEEKDSILKPITNTSDLTKAYADSEYGKIKKIRSLSKTWQVWQAPSKRWRR